MNFLDICDLRLTPEAKLVLLGFKHVGHKELTYLDISDITKLTVPEVSFVAQELKTNNINKSTDFNKIVLTIDLTEKEEDGINITFNVSGRPDDPSN